MGAKVYCIASAKGGSGKTMVTANIASFLASLGKRCLIVDCDAATQGMTLLYIDEVSSKSNGKKVGLFEYRRAFEDATSQNEPKRVEDNIITLSDGVDLFPATYTFSSDSREQNTASIKNLEKFLPLLREHYDLIFLDAQAGADEHSRVAMSKDISDEVVIVSEYDPMSSAGVERLKQIVGQDLDFSRTAVLLNKMLPEFVGKFSEFLSVANYLPPIPWNADVVRAYAKRKLALDLERGNAFTLAIIRTVTALMGQDAEIDIERWTRERAYALRAPLEEQYAAAEAELDAALREKNKLERIRRLRLLYQGYIVVVASALAVGALAYFAEMSDGLWHGFQSEWLVVLLILIVAPLVYWSTYRLFRREKTAESTRHDRVISSLEGKLRDLEALRAADYETIVKRKEGYRQYF